MWSSDLRIDANNWQLVHFGRRPYHFIETNLLVGEHLTAENGSGYIMLVTLSSSVIHGNGKCNAGCGASISSSMHPCRDAPGREIPRCSAVLKTA